MGIFLGIDIGYAKTGVARSTGTLAEPLLVIREKNPRIVADRIASIATKEQAEMVIIGMPQGRLETLAHEISNWLSVKGINVTFADETLTTQDAQWFSREAGIGQKKRKALEDAYAATLILQAYLDNSAYHS